MDLTKRHNKIIEVESNKDAVSLISLMELYSLKLDEAQLIYDYLLANNSDFEEHYIVDCPNCGDVCSDFESSRFKEKRTDYCDSCEEEFEIDSEFVFKGIYKKKKSLVA